MNNNLSITYSAPSKIHLLGEHSVVYGKPAILTSVDLRIKVTISEDSKPIINDLTKKVKKVIEPIVKKYLKLKELPPYNIKINSEAPIGSGLGSSSAISASYIAALLSYLKVKWDLELINKLAYEAEKVFHGNPSGADTATVIYGGLIWFRKEDADLKLIQRLSFSIPTKLSKNFILINTGTPKETTKDMVKLVSQNSKVKSQKYKKVFDDQERLVKELFPVLKEGNEKEFIRIIKEGEKNLESIGVVSKYAQDIIRQIEKIGGAAKICGGGGKTKATGILLAYHPNRANLLKMIKSINLAYFSAKLGVEGLRRE